MYEKNCRWIYYRYESFPEADKKKVNCNKTTLIDVPFFIPFLFHGLYLTTKIKKMFNPCRSYKIIK